MLLNELNLTDPRLPSNLSKKYQEFIYVKSAWVVGTQSFSNKIDAMLAAENTNNKIKFITDPRWESVDFSKVPDIPFDQLLVERAAQIRRDYDYIRLAIGAGWDTNTVLESFCRAGAKIDEIVINRKFVKSPNDLCCYEETHVTPHILEHYKDSDEKILNYIKKQLKDVGSSGNKTNILKETKAFFNYAYRKELKNDWFYNDDIESFSKKLNKALLKVKGLLGGGSCLSSNAKVVNSI